MVNMGLPNRQDPSRFYEDELSSVYKIGHPASAFTEHWMEKFLFAIAEASTLILLTSPV